MDEVLVGSLKAPQRDADRARSTNAWWMKRNCPKSNAPINMNANMTNTKLVSRNTAPLLRFCRRREILLGIVPFSLIGRVDTNVGISHLWFVIQRILCEYRVDLI